jgi:hypothetical protein
MSTCHLVFVEQIQEPLPATPKNLWIASNVRQWSEIDPAVFDNHFGL